MASIALQATTVVFGMAGQYLVGQKKVGGFYAWLVSNSLLLVNAVVSGLVVLPLLYAVSFAQSVQNIRQWGRAAQADAGPVVWDIGGATLAGLGGVVALALLTQVAAPGWELGLLQVVGSVTLLLGGWLVGRMRASGFAVWCLSNLSMMSVYALKGQWILVALHVGYFALCAGGLLTWRRLAAGSASRRALVARAAA